jgi:hypothetical protein
MVSAMLPFWRKAAMFAGALGGLLAGSCAGQQLEGRWRGPFPLTDATECVLNLYANRTFDLACGESNWIGAGRYRRDGDRMRFDFTVLHRNRTPVSRLPVLALSLQGRGNTVVLRNEAGQRFALERRL